MARGFARRGTLRVTLVALALCTETLRLEQWTQKVSASSLMMSKQKGEKKRLTLLLRMRRGAQPHAKNNTLRAR